MGPQVAVSGSLSGSLSVKREREREREIYSLYQTRRVSRAEPNKNLTKKIKKDHKDELEDPHNQSALSTQIDTDHSDLPQ